MIMMAIATTNAWGKPTISETRCASFLKISLMGVVYHIRFVVYCRYDALEPCRREWPCAHRDLGVFLHAHHCIPSRIHDSTTCYVGDKRAFPVGRCAYLFH